MASGPAGASGQQGHWAQGLRPTVSSGPHPGKQDWVSPPAHRPTARPPHSPAQPGLGAVPLGSHSSREAGRSEGRAVLSRPKPSSWGPARTPSPAAGQPAATSWDPPGPPAPSDTRPPKPRTPQSQAEPHLPREALPYGPLGAPFSLSIFSTSHQFHQFSDAQFRVSVSEFPITRSSLSWEARLSLKLCCV